MNQFPLSSGVLARKIQDSLHATWVLVDEASHVENAALQHDPAISLRVVLGDLRRGNALLALSLGLRPPAATAAPTYLADDGIWSVLGDDVRGVDHVELRSGVLASEGQDGKLTTRVLGEEAGDIQHVAVQDNPAVFLRVVLRHVLQLVAAGLLLLRRCCPGRSLACAALVHTVLVRATSEAGARHSASQASTGQFGKGRLLHVGAQHELAACLPCNAAKDHAVQQ
mmetsp:Transcript_21924/g.59890  ORF Transcript_21924/g.59890 Transcript_21924/m.59890 type:complete len:226 (+) Transcript_21924:439-1116(+)